MCEIVCWWRKHMTQIESWKNKHIDGFYTKTTPKRRITFVLGYLRMILWKISSAVSIKHRILATFNIKKKSILTACIVCLKKSTWHKPNHWRILHENHTKRRIQQAVCNNNDIEDEYHFILECSKYVEIRRKYIKVYILIEMTFGDSSKKEIASFKNVSITRCLNSNIKFPLFNSWIYIEIGDISSWNFTHGFVYHISWRA
jgi:transcription antitermination factor NusG